MALPLNTLALQKVDRWLGMPVCALLTLWRRCADAVAPARSTTPAKRVLFVKFAEQGSTVLAYPAIRRAVQMFGASNVYFVVFEENRFILDLMRLVPPENVVTIRHLGVFDMALQASRALLQFRRLGIDAAVDLEFFSRSSAAMTFLSGARLRAGFHTFFGDGPYRGDLMTHRLLYNPYLHTSQIFQQVVEALHKSPAMLPTDGAQPPSIEEWLPKFSPEEAECDAVREIVRREGEEVGANCSGSVLILLNPNASDLIPLRKWPTERYVELARRLLARFPRAIVVLTGAPDEAAKAQMVAAEIGSSRCISLAGKTTLRQLLVLYTIADLLVTNDSGPAHFASMTSISVITLFGPETPSLFAARTPRNTPIWMGISCSPCVNAYNNRQSPCTNNVCMQQITTDRVFEEACRSLSARGLPSSPPDEAGLSTDSFPAVRPPAQNAAARILPMREATDQAPVR